MTQELMYQLTQSLGWTVLHALWQFGLVSLVCWIVLSNLRQLDSRLRYWIAFSSLIIASSWSISTFLQTLWVFEGQTLQAVFESATLTNLAGSDTLSGMATVTTASPVSWSTWMSTHIHWIGIAWLFGACWYALRLAFGLKQVGELRHNGLMDASDYWKNRFSQLIQESGLDPKKIKIQLSGKAYEPISLGFLRPLIILPYGLVGEIPPAQLEAIVWHELAHVRRNDYLFNLIQRLLLSFFFFHPAAHWISRQIDREREHACDDYAVKRSSNPHALVRALAFLSLGCQSSTEYELAMAARGRHHGIYTRMQRLVDTKSPSKTMKTNRLFPLLFFVLLGGAMLTATTDEQAKSSLDFESFTLLGEEKIENASDCVEVIVVDSLPPAAIERQAERLAIIEERLLEQEERLREQEAKLDEREANLDEREAMLDNKENAEEEQLLTSSRPEPIATPDAYPSQAIALGEVMTAPLGTDFYGDLHSGLLELLMRDRLMSPEDCAATLHISPGALVINDRRISSDMARPYSALLARFRIIRTPGRQIRVERQGLRIGHPGQEACSWEGEVWSAG
ncbi:MAG: M56 family metallopeptidase [Bacteroidota bacterium]